MYTQEEPVGKVSQCSLIHHHEYQQSATRTAFREPTNITLFNSSHGLLRKTNSEVDKITIQETPTTTYVETT
jgi:hypothetical protein